MKLLKRIDRGAQGIFGQFINDDGATICETLEHAYQDYSGKWVPKLPSGNYSCVRGIHRLKDMVPFETFEITGVEGHVNILFHPGNYNEDSEGCVLMGKERVGNMITESRDTWSQWMAVMVGIDSFQLQVFA